MAAPAHERPRLLLVGLVVLSVLCAAWAANQVHLVRMKRELTSITAEKLEEFRGEADGGKPNRVATNIVVAKPFVLWGAPTAKLSLFVEHKNRQGETLIEGYEFFFARSEDGTWNQTESGRCTSEHCTLEGKKLLDALDDAL